VTQDPTLESWEILTPDKPLLGRSERAPDGCENVTVYRVGDEWVLLYSEGLLHQHLAYATSADLVRWSFKGVIDLPAQRWMAKRYGAPAVWQEDNHWFMVLMGIGEDDRATLGMLTSNDAIHWNPLPERTE